MAEQFLMKNEKTGVIKKTYIGYSWTMLFFNAFAPLIRGDFKDFFILAVINIAVYILSPNLIFYWCICNIPAFIFSFIWNKIYTERLLKDGYTFAESEEKNSYANIKLNTKNTAGYIFCGICCILSLGMALNFNNNFTNSLFSSVDDTSDSSSDTMLMKDEIRDSEPAGISPRGIASKVFNLMSDYTDLQREELFSKIKNKIVDWTLPIYEVRKISNNNYEIVILPEKHVGCEVYINNPSEEELETLRTIKTGEYINFKGKISGLTATRSFIIRPAIIYGEPIRNMQKATFTFKDCYTETQTYISGKIGNNDIWFYPGWYQKDYCSSLNKHKNKKYKIEFYKTYDEHDGDDVYILSNMDSM